MKEMHVKIVNTLLNIVSYVDLHWQLRSLETSNVSHSLQKFTRDL